MTGPSQISSKWRMQLLRAIDVAKMPLALMLNSRVSYANVAFINVYGPCIGHSLADFFQPESEEQINWLIAGARGEADKIVLPLRDDIESDQSGSNVMVQVWPIDDAYCLLSLRDDYSLSRLADLDELTRLPNRRKAMMLLDIEKSRANRELGFCLTLADIDHFKRVNDTYGHEIGDMVLRRVAAVMTSALREGDWVARWGGEEFIIFTTNSDVVTGLQPIERIREQIEGIVFEEPQELRVTMSFGLSSSAGEKNVRDIIQKADMLLYEAKANGRNRTEWQNVDTITWVASNIRSAVESGKVTAEILPIFDWEGNVVARQAQPRLRNHDYAQTEKMLAAADRIRQRGMIDIAMMRSADAQLAHDEGNTPVFFPLHEALVKVNDDGSRRMQHEHACASIDAGVPLAQGMTGMAVGSDKPLALLNFDVATAPTYLLGHPGLTHIVFTNPAESVSVLPFLVGRVRCYAVCAADCDDKQKQRLKQAGFDGWAQLQEGAPVPKPLE